MGLKTLFVFNPEHDYALAVGQGSYTPPSEVVKLRRKFSLLPALYAANGDFILIPSDFNKEVLTTLPYYSYVLEKDITLVQHNNLQSVSHKINNVTPWGWDHAIVKELLSSGVNKNLLPSLEKIDVIRNLSHRRTIIPFREYIAYEMGIEVKNSPVELFSVEEAKTFINSHETIYFKAPWSSSGRGIVVSDHISNKGLLEWLHGVIKKQGSVIAEPAWNRNFDFATEWRIKDNTPIFLGYSVFETSSRGKYHGNIEDSQDKLLELIKKNVPKFNKEIIEIQKTALKKFIAHSYEGFLGIDMLSDLDGDINPCVEINLRLTMGHIPIISNSDFLNN